MNKSKFVKLKSKMQKQYLCAEKEKKKIWLCNCNIWCFKLYSKRVKTVYQRDKSCFKSRTFIFFDVNSLFGFEEVAQGCITIDVDDKFYSNWCKLWKNKLQTDITFENKKMECFSKEQIQ